eukprot:COSAG02_NODE_11_length_58539_cov_103.119473_30_plen_604_part_00
MLLRAALGASGAAPGAANPVGTLSRPDAVVLAPMVRLGTLPLRLLALERGAKLVYTEEIVDAKLAATERSFDARLGTTDWRGAGGQCILRTCQRESGRLVVQLGTSGDTATLLAAAKMLLSDELEHENQSVAAGCRQLQHHGIVAVDINLGCPKRIATSGGSGSALFTDRKRCEAAVRTLREFLPAEIAVTCKVRLCPDVTESLERCRGLASAGAVLICVHARRASERSRDSCRWAELHALRLGLEQQGSKMPLLVANGDALDSSAVTELREASGCPIVAVGRGALSADNVFAPSELRTVHAGSECATMSLCQRYTQIATDLENSPLNTSFVLQWIINSALRGVGCTPLPAAASVLQDTAAALRDATTALAVAQAVGMESFYHSVVSRGLPAPPSHRYSADYFENLDTQSDWMAGPSRMAVAEMRAANVAIDSKQKRSVSNDDFRRLVAASAAMGGRGVDLFGQDDGRSSHKRQKKRRKKQVEDCKATLLWRQEQQCGDTGGGRPRYFVIQQSAPAEKRLGYFAPAWRCKCVVGGVPYEGGWGKSKWRAEQKAAEVALKALPIHAASPAQFAAQVPVATTVTTAPRARVALLMPRAVHSRLKR